MFSHSLSEDGVYKWKKISGINIFHLTSQDSRGTPVSDTSLNDQLEDETFDEDDHSCGPPSTDTLSPSVENDQDYETPK